MRSPITVKLRTVVPRKTRQSEQKSGADIKERTCECGRDKGARERLFGP